MGTVELTKKEKALVISLLKEKLSALQTRKEHFEDLNKRDEDFPDNIMDAIDKELNFVESILPKLDKHFQA